MPFFIAFLMTIIYGCFSRSTALADFITILLILRQSDAQQAFIWNIHTTSAKALYTCSLVSSSPAALK